MVKGYSPAALSGVVHSPLSGVNNNEDSNYKNKTQRAVLSRPDALGAQREDGALGRWVGQKCLRRAGRWTRREQWRGWNPG